MKKRVCVVGIFAFLFMATIAFGSTSAWTVGNNKSAPGPYNPNASTTFNPANQPVTITRPTPGRYQIVFSGLAALTKGGNVQVTPVNTLNHHCSVTSFVKSGADVVIRIACYNNAGQASDAQYSLLFTTQ